MQLKSKSRAMMTVCPKYACKPRKRSSLTTLPSPLVLSLDPPVRFPDVQITQSFAAQPHRLSHAWLLNLWQGRGRVGRWLQHAGMRSEASAWHVMACTKMSRSQRQALPEGSGQPTATRVHVVAVQVDVDVGVVARILQKVHGLRSRVEQVGLVPVRQPDHGLMGGLAEVAHPAEGAPSGPASKTVGPCPQPQSAVTTSSSPPVPASPVHHLQAQPHPQVRRLICQLAQLGSRVGPPLGCGRPRVLC